MSCRRVVEDQLFSKGVCDGVRGESLKLKYQKLPVTYVAHLSCIFKFVPSAIVSITICLWIWSDAI